MAIGSKPPRWSGSWTWTGARTSRPRQRGWGPWAPTLLSSERIHDAAPQAGGHLAQSVVLAAAARGERPDDSRRDRRRAPRPGVVGAPARRIRGGDRPAAARRALPQHVPGARGVRSAAGARGDGPPVLEPAQQRARLPPPPAGPRAHPERDRLPAHRAGPHRGAAGARGGSGARRARAGPLLAQ